MDEKPSSPPEEEGSKPHRFPTYAEFVQQSRRVLGLPEKPPPTECLNPGLRDLMNEAFRRAELYYRKSEDRPES